MLVQATITDLPKQIESHKDYSEDCNSCVNCKDDYNDCADCRENCEEVCKEECADPCGVCRNGECFNFVSQGCEECDSCRECDTAKRDHNAKDIFHTPPVSLGRPKFSYSRDNVKRRKVEPTEFLPGASHGSGGSLSSGSCQERHGEYDGRYNYGQMACAPFGQDQQLSETLPGYSAADMFDALYCHWDDHTDGHEFRFSSHVDLDNHLKSAHLPSEPVGMDSGFSCHWDACHTNVNVLDDLLFHIKKDHIEASGHLPHQSCKHDATCHPVQTSASSSSTSSISSSTTSDTSGALNKSYDEFGLGIPYMSSGSAYQSSPDNALTPQHILQCHWDSCGFTSSDQPTLDDHLLRKHIYPQGPGGPGMLTPAYVSPYQCEWNSCKYESSAYQDMVAHMKTDHSLLDSSVSPVSTTTPSSNIAPLSPPRDVSVASDCHKCLWQCSDGQTCNKVFESAKELSDHLVSDHAGSGKKEYCCMWHGCERSGRPFKQKQKIIRHLQTHTRYRPFVCEVCGSCFAEEVVLKQHKRIHSGERPYACKVCGKTFAASTALTVHMRTHTGEKPLKCKFPGCDKRFSESSNLAKHMKTHYK
uniref:ARAD1A04642p n=1 Tax=Blastobotrys adeninivorans TaxID=409370 RepID=A0A060SXK6_BLAAD